MLRRVRDAGGRMPLRAHLVELRNRLLVSAVTVCITAVIGWFLYDDPAVPQRFQVLDLLTRPLTSYAEESGRDVGLNFSSITTPFDLKLKVSLWVGVILASPMWIYQLFAFITPGLTRKERWYAVGFLAVSVPLFLGGIVLAYLVLPNAVRFFLGLTPDNILNLAQIDLYITFVTRIMLGFGIAFLLPVVMVALNFLGVLGGRAMLKGWRVAIVACFVFAAVASPTPDIGVMFALAMPMIVLYLLAVAVALVNDRRRRRRDGTLGLEDLDDDAASPRPPDPGGPPGGDPAGDPGPGGGVGASAAPAGPEPVAPSELRTSDAT